MNKRFDYCMINKTLFSEIENSMVYVRHRITITVMCICLFCVKLCFGNSFEFSFFSEMDNCRAYV